MNPETLHAARVLMGDSLGFHIIFVLFGLTLPILVSWFEWSGILRKDNRLIEVARFWSKIMTVLVISGVISGTIIALQMSLVWPGILKFGGEVIGLPFMFETYAFLIEAVFLALYMSTWDNKRISPTLHAIFGLFIVLGSTLSAFAITSINGWMNLPTGFDIIDGKFANIDVLQAMFSRTSLIEFFHSMPGYYLAASLTIAGLYAFKILRSKKKDRLGPKHKLDWLIIKRLMIFASIMFIFSGITADLTGKYLAKYEPVKLAAIELHDETLANAPLIVGGVPGPNGTISGPYFEIPNALSILAGNTPSTEVTGFNEFKPEERPPLYIHTFFDIKMTLINILIVMFLAFFIAVKWHPNWLKNKFNLLVLGISGYLAIIIIELGWMMTEIGRQPWAVRGYLTTEQAVTKTHDITNFGYFFPLSYVILFVVTILAVKRIVKNESSRRKVTK